MSLSDLPRSHFDPLNHYPLREEQYPGYFPPSDAPAAFLSHEITQLSNALYGHRPAFFNMNPLSPEEMERFQELSNKYEPELPVSTRPRPSILCPVDTANRVRSSLPNSRRTQLRWTMPMPIPPLLQRPVYGLEFRNKRLNQPLLTVFLGSGCYTSAIAYHERRWQLWLER